MSAFRICNQLVHSIIIDAAAAFQRFGSTRQYKDFGLIDIISMAAVYCIAMISFVLPIGLLLCLQLITQLADKMLRLDERVKI